MIDNETFSAILQGGFESDKMVVLVGGTIKSFEMVDDVKVITKFKLSDLSIFGKT